MTEQKFYTPLKIGLFLVVLSYFLFSFHGVFTLQWIGEWNSFPGLFSFIILVEDISGTIGLVFRLIASAIALAGVIIFFARKKLAKPTAHSVIRWVLIFEAIYWMGLIVTAIADVRFFVLALGHRPIASVLTSLVTTVLPEVLESIVLPVALLVTAFKLSPTRPISKGIKWGLISGALYIFVLWLLNSGMWFLTVRGKGIGYLTSFPFNFFSFAVTIVGLFALGVFSVYFARKSAGTDVLENLNLGTIGVIVTALGLYFLWNYLTWIFFGGDYVWSDWYAWFLGHNMDLWLLSLPLVGLPLIWKRKTT